MGFPIEDGYRPNRVTHNRQPRIEPQNDPIVRRYYGGGTSRIGEHNNTGATVRQDLNRQLQENASPYRALQLINELPRPDRSNRTSVREYKEQRATIADYALNNSTPPSRTDFDRFPPRLADIEYTDAITGYNGQIAELRVISADAHANPDTILSVDEAVQQIRDLTRPDRDDPQQIQAYNRDRAEIADTALLFAEGPKYEDFGDSQAYRDALMRYGNDTTFLRSASDSADSTEPPVITHAEAEAAAVEIINRYGGEGNINENDGAAIGRELAEIAEQNPHDAAAIGNKLLLSVEGTDRGDDIARGFVENRSIEELRSISTRTGGETFLRNLQENLYDGNVNGKESEAASKIDEAITGFSYRSMSGNPQEDAGTVEEQLQNLPPEMREGYLQAVLEDPYGQNAIRFAAEMSHKGEQLLGLTLGELYKSNPSGTIELLTQIANEDPYGSFPISYHSGLSYVVSQSGNDDLIEAFAQNEIDRAKSDPDEVRGYLNAVTAYSGLSPEALQEVMEINPDFFKAVEEAGRLTGGPPSSAGFENLNIWEPGPGLLLDKVLQIRDADGLATPEAIRVFEIGVENVGANFQSMEGVGAFFIEHADQLVDLYTDPLKAGTPGSEVLEHFFANVIYSPIADHLDYNGASLVDAVMGDENGNGGVLGGIVDRYLNDANASANDPEQDRLIGQRIGFLWSSLSEGFIGGVDNYKSRWNDDKEFRDFTFDMLGRGLGKIASKFKLPGELISIPLDAVQGIYDARAESEKKAQLEIFSAAFSEINNTMYTRLNNFDIANDNVEGVHGGFTDAYNWQGVQTMYNNVINN